MKKKLLLCLLAMAAFLPVWAETAKEMADDYGLVRINAKICRAKYEVGVLNTQTGATSAEEAYSEFLTCKTGVTKQAKAIYTRLLPRLKTADAKRDLKDFQVALMTSIETGEPRDGELKIQYQQRHSAMDARIEDAWQRLQLNF